MHPVFFCAWIGVGLLLAPVALADTARLPAVADTNLSSHPSETDFNFGHSTRIRLKGHEMLMLLKFDLAAARGWTVESASLFLHAAGPHQLKTIGLSTVAVDWVEGDGRGTRADGGATFTWADFGKRRWGGPQSDFTDVALTAQGTLVDYADLKQRDGGWLEIAVAPRLVRALIAGESFGLAVVDEKGQTRANNDVHSREQTAFAPYLLVTGKPPASAARTPVRAIGAAPAPRPAGPPPPPPPLATATVLARPGGEPAVRDGRVRAWAYGECEKAHPISGNLLEETGPDGYAGQPAGDYRRRNTVWDGGSSTIRLSAGRNEFVACHLCAEAVGGSLDNIRVEVAVPGLTVAVFKDWYVKDGAWFPEAAVPLAGRFSIPDPANRIEGQRNQSLLLDVYVPHEAAAGDHVGRIRICADGVRSFELPLVVTVWNFTLPDALRFVVDLNAYTPPGDAEMELQFQRMAHAHRATLNILGYNQAGRANPDYVPPLEGSGRDLRVHDWTAFDRRHGRYFDGSAFADLPRRGVPVTHAYLPFCEGWPSDLRQHYRYTPATTAYPEIIAEHALRAPPIEEAFDAQFKEEFVAVLRQFAAHYRERGWTRTQFQFYLNNKYYFRDPKQGGRGSSWWLLDEPMDRDDWLALRFFGRLFQQAMAQSPNPRFVFRADVSRPQWQRDWLDGLVNLMCVSGEFFRKHDRCLALQRAQAVRFVHYGTGNDIRASNLAGEAWALKAYLAGADGILPWNSLGPESSLDRPTPTTLLYGGARFGINGPLASLRLKAMRRGQQDVEYLALLAANMGWDRGQTAAAVAPLLKLDARTRESFVDDAGRTVFDHLTGEQFARLRASVAAVLNRSR